MRVLMVSFWFYPGRGGLERQAWQLSRRLQRQGVQVIAVTACRPGLSRFEMVEGVRIHRVWAGGGAGLARTGHLSSYLNVVVFCFSLCAFLFVHAREFDVVHVHQALFPAFVSVFVGGWLGKRVAVKVSGSGASGNIRQMQRRWYNRAMLPVIRQADVLIGLSDEARDELLAAGFDKRRIVIIPNGVDLDEFQPSQPAERTGRKGVLCAGRFTYEKGQEVLARAWRMLSVPNACLTFAGDGPTRASVAELAGPGVEFIGEVENMADVYRRANIFVLPSLGEGMSNALLEAMACGMACIVSNVGGNRALVVTGVNGLLFESGSAEQLADSLQRLLGDDLLADKLGAAARATVVGRCGFDRVVQTYRTLYMQMANSEQTAPGQTSR